MLKRRKAQIKLNKKTGSNRFKTANNMSCITDAISSAHMERHHLVILALVRHFMKVVVFFFGIYPNLYTFVVLYHCKCTSVILFRSLLLQSLLFLWRHPVAINVRILVRIQYCVGLLTLDILTSTALQQKILKNILTKLQLMVSPVDLGIYRVSEPIYK